MIGSSIVTKYEMKDGKPVLMREPKVFFIDDGDGKAIGINLFIGKRPQIAFGNTEGDKEMLEWTTAGDGAAPRPAGAARRRGARVRLRPGERAARHQGRHLQPGADGQPPRQNGWTVISMKDDWNTIFADGIAKAK